MIRRRIDQWLDSPPIPREVAFVGIMIPLLWLWWTAFKAVLTLLGAL